MANLPNLNQIVNDTAANAVPVNENFTTIKTHLDTEMINRDGSVAMTQPLLLSAIAPTNENHAVRLRDIGAQGELGIPTGTMFDYAGTSTPEGRWLLCDGAILNSADEEYLALSAIIGLGQTGLYWDGSSTVGPTQFQLPDSRGRSSIGGGGVFGVGATVGSEAPTLLEHNHTGSEVVVSGPHTHTVSDPTHFHGTSSYASSSRVTMRNGDGSGSLQTGVTISSSGTYSNTASRSTGITIPDDSGDHTHDVVIAPDGVPAGANGNYHPSLAVTKIIRY